MGKKTRGKRDKGIRTQKGLMWKIFKNQSKIIGQEEDKLFRMEGGASRGRDRKKRRKEGDDGERKGQR